MLMVLNCRSRQTILVGEYGSSFLVMTLSSRIVGQYNEKLESNLLEPYVFLDTLCTVGRASPQRHPCKCLGRRPCLAKQVVGGLIRKHLSNYSGYC